MLVGYSLVINYSVVEVPLLPLVSYLDLCSQLQGFLLQLNLVSLVMYKYPMQFLLN